MMANEPGVGRMVPQDPHAQSYMFVPSGMGSRENQKNYVFVDEHNRHKRLKVMRACEGCRRRKIKCDAATTNTWPCSACVRLKLQCIPPSVSYDADSGQPGLSYDPNRTDGHGIFEELVMDAAMPPYPHPHAHAQPPPPPPPPPPQPYQAGPLPVQELPRQVPLNAGPTAYGTSSFIDHSSAHDAPYPVSLAGVPDPSGDMSAAPFQTSAVSYSTPPAHAVALVATPDSWHSSDPYSADHLTDALSELRVDESGVAPYISHQRKALAEAPPLEEFDEYVRNLPTPSGADLTVRIPPELMPPEQKALRYFDIFFKYVHPYVPVINKRYFYQQWHTNRESISPLLLEAIFACASGLTDDSAQGSRWLALAGKHADCFMDVPRLSTLQALLLLLKAREASPRRGYYFRSWMTAVTLIDMAKDLGLDDHHQLHRQRIPCGSTYNDCVTKNRVWQTLFIYELMIGVPQGRSDMSVDPETVDFDAPSPSPGLDDFDLRISRDWVFMSRMIRNVRRMNDIVAKVKKQKDWGNDPRWYQLAPFFNAWLAELPPDLQVNYPADGSPPWLPSHFVGNMHSYYELSVIMLHRPQLAASESFALDVDWKRHMKAAYSATKNMCRLQESILATSGLSGLRCMQRGLGFHIYAILTCTVLHLVAVTSPDPEFRSNAADYFSRHMRILEQCINSWPMPHVKAQIDALREAFSADTARPFVLKRSFPFGSPQMGQFRNGLVNSGQPAGHPSPEASLANSQTLEYPGQSLSPPLSTPGGVNSQSGSPVPQVANTSMAGSTTRQSPPTMAGSMPMMDPSAWNPSKIFDQWNTAFGPPQHQTSQTSASATGFPGYSGALDSPGLQDTFSADVHSGLSPGAAHPTSSHSGSGSGSGSGPGSASGPYAAAAAINVNANANVNPNPNANPNPNVNTNAGQPLSHTHTFVSPSMWQSSVASVYEAGQKRAWDFGDAAAAAAGGGGGGGGGGGMGGVGLMGGPLSKRPTQVAPSSSSSSSFR